MKLLEENQRSEKEQGANKYLPGYQSSFEKYRLVLWITQDLPDRNKAE